MLKDLQGMIQREGANGATWTFANEAEAAKQRGEFEAAELAAAPKALRDRITAAAAVLEQVRGT